jgi:capsular polysaccharide biosynthesis protein
VAGSERDLSNLFATALPVQTGRAADVLYVPDLKMQVVGGKLVPQEAIAEPWLLGFEVRRGFQGAADAYAVPFGTRRMDREVCVLSNFYSRNFYHWLTEEMHKVVVLEESGWKGDYVLHGLPGFAAGTLRMLGIDDSRMILHLPGPTTFASAVFTTSVHGWNLHSHEGVFRAARDRLTAASGGAFGRGRRIWLERIAGVNNPGRDLQNPAEVWDVLRRYGVEPVDMGALPVAEQVRTAMEAGCLLGVHGAGFVHSMFMAPGSAVVECFSPLFINPGIFDICRVLRHRHHMVVHGNAYAAYAHGDQVRVDPVQLDMVLRALPD